MWVRFCVIALGTLVVPLDSAVNIAFPSITHAFDVPQAAIQWVIVCYVIVYATLLLIFGRLGDLFGHLRVFQIGLSICAIAFVGSGMAQRFEWLLATRALQGVGSAMVLSCGPALATSLFSDQQRTRALGSYAAVIGLGAAIGPTLGGLMVGIWGWSAVFWFRAPIAVFSLAFSFFLQMPQQIHAKGRFDLFGAVWLAVGLSMLLIAISRLRHGGISFAEIAAYVGVIGLSAAMLSGGRRNADDAVVSLSIFRSRDLALITLTGVAVNVVGFAVMLFVPYYLARLSMLPVAFGGVILAASPAGIVCASQVGPQLVARFDTKSIAFGGALLVAIGTGVIGFWGRHESVLLMVFASCVHGFGLGLYQVAQLDLSTITLPRESRGIAGSLVMLTRTLGVIIAASGLTAVFIALEVYAQSTTGDERFLSAFQGTFRISALGLLAYLVLICSFSGTWRSGTAR